MPPRLPKTKKKTTRPTKKKTKTLHKTRSKPEPILDDSLTIILYGPSGAGKTSLAANFPDCGFLIDSQERGVKFLSQRNLIPKPVWTKELSINDRAWTKLLDAIYHASDDGSIKTLVVEALTGIENICFRQHCREKFNSNWSGEREGGGFFDYAKGPKSAAKLEIPKLIDAFNAVWESGKTVILTAHTQTKEVPSPLGGNVMRFSPYCDKDVWQVLHKWASCVLFLAPKINEDKQARGLRAIPKEAADRFIWTSDTGFCDAKNWIGLGPVIPCGNSGKEAYRNLMEEIQVPF